MYVIKNEFRRCDIAIEREFNDRVSDIDECSSVRGVCANGQCINTPGSYVCQCDAGFTPSLDRTRCIGELYSHMLVSSACNVSRCLFLSFWLRV